MLDLIETLFARYGIRSLRYDGRMSREARELALAEFRQLGGPKVILVRYAHVLFASLSLRCLVLMLARASSTKCGGVGLNLVSANRVVK